MVQSVVGDRREVCRKSRLEERREPRVQNVYPFSPLRLGEQLALDFEEHCDPDERVKDRTNWALPFFICYTRVFFVTD
jgi:hypothetical protein